MSGAAARPCAQRLIVLVAGLAWALGGCGSTIRVPRERPIPSRLLAQARPIGRGPAFQPPVRGPVIGPCRRTVGSREAVHVEVFAADRVALLPAGIGTRGPRRAVDGTITEASCYGALVTLSDEGIVLVRPGGSERIRDLFRAWGQPLSPTRLLSFRAHDGARVSAYVDGRRWAGSPGTIPLRRHAEIVLEVGPHVPPHTSFTFPGR